jgi:glycosyltransferase involved in cell wall biosynthesis
MSNNKAKIAFVIGASFPTVKAYGVTSRETINVILENKFQTKVFCLDGKYSDSDYKKINQIILPFLKNWTGQLLIYLGTLGTMKLNFICWRIGLATVIIRNSQVVKDFKPDIIWTRDPMIAYLYLRKFIHVKIILEVHDHSGAFFYKMLFKYNSRVNYFPINQKNKNFLIRLNSKAKINIAPMGIQTKNLATKNDCVKFVNTLKRRKYKEIRIGYIGKISPGGYSKGIEDLIEFAKYAQNKNLDLSVTLVGATDNELIKLNNTRRELAIKKTYLDFKSHIKHSQALNLMRRFDVLVLPAYSSDKYVGMPLKLLEYLSTGKISIIANVFLYKNIFQNSFNPFYYTPGDVLSLEESINSALRRRDLDKHLVAGINFASNYSWTNRTLNMIYTADPKSRS